MEFDQAKYEEFLSSGSKSPMARVYRKVSSGTCSRVRSEIPSDAIGKKDVVANHIIRNARVNVSHETHKVDLLMFSPFMPVPFLSSRSPGVPINPYGVTGTLSDDRDDVRVNFRREKLEQLSVQ